jgi:hypothetical protein
VARPAGEPELLAAARQATRLAVRQGKAGLDEAAAAAAGALRAWLDAATPLLPQLGAVSFAAGVAPLVVAAEVGALGLGRPADFGGRQQQQLPEPVAGLRRAAAAFVAAAATTGPAQGEGLAALGATDLGTVLRCATGVEASRNHAPVALADPAVCCFKALPSVATVRTHARMCGFGAS